MLKLLYLEPAEPRLLVGAEDAAEPRGRVDRLHAIEAAQLGARVVEPFVGARLGERGEQGVEQRRLPGREAELPRRPRLPQRGQRAVAAEPRLGQHAERPVGQRDRAITSPVPASSVAGTSRT